MANGQEQSNTQPGAFNARDFWFAVVCTAFLVVTFALYLPLRFQHQEIIHDLGDRGGHMMAKGDIGHGVSMYHEAADVQSGLSIDLSYEVWPLEGHPLFGATSTQATLNFYVNSKPEQAPVPVGELQIEHTKLMHVIGIRDDMNEFFHIHPQPVDDSSVFTTTHTFQKPGQYKMWSQVKKDDVVHTIGHPIVDVQGMGERSSKSVSFSRTLTVENYQIALKSNEPIIKGVKTPLSFNVHTLAGQEIEFEPYLGADMHLVVIKDDLKQFMHAHPEEHDMDMDMDMDEHHGVLRVISEAKAHGIKEEGIMPGREDEAINFHVVFTEPGLYKAFAQFRPRGSLLPPDEALTASFWLQVEDATARRGGADDQREDAIAKGGGAADRREGRAPLRFSQGVLVLISLVLILLLSFMVKRFIKA